MNLSFGNWAVQRCLEAASTAEERRKIVSCMRQGRQLTPSLPLLTSYYRGRIVDLATNCYGCHVLQKALDCEEDIRLLIVSELLLGDPAQTLVNKHASHVWSKVGELSLFTICSGLLLSDHGALLDATSTSYICLVRC